MAARRRELLPVILALALGLRLAYGLAQDHGAIFQDSGGDSGWYLRNGYALVSGDIPTGIELSRLPTAPLYLVFVGVWQALFAPEAAVIAIRVAQAVLGTATVYFAYRLAVTVTGDERAGFLLAGVLALSPPFVIEPAQIETETLYIFFLTAGMWLYVAAVGPRNSSVRRTPGMLVAAAFLLGLATLTRAVLLLFPAGLALHLLLVYGRRAGLRRVLLLTGIYLVVVSTWTVYNFVRWERIVVGAEGLAAGLYIGAAGWDGPAAVDAGLQEIIADDDDTLTGRDFVQGFRQTVRNDLFAYVRGRATELAAAYAQPYGTTFFTGESLKARASDWLRDDRSVDGLLRLMRGEAFWPKVSIFVLHGLALIGGLAGMWLLRRRWRVVLPLAGFILYTTLLHLVLPALPRYIFPTELFWWAFAAAAFVQGLERFSRRRRAAQAAARAADGGLRVS